MIKTGCNNPPGDNLSARICANLAFQKADSQLALIYDSVPAQLGARPGTLRRQFITLHRRWRALRDKHCVWLLLHMTMQAAAAQVPLPTCHACASVPETASAN